MTASPKRTASPSTDPAPADTAPRRPGRPRREIDLDAVAEAAANLFAEGGHEAVSIEATAERLSVPRATLYRTVPTKEGLLSLVFERVTDQLGKDAKKLMDETSDPEKALVGLLRLHIEGAIQTRQYLTVFFGGTGVSPEVYARWQKWSRSYEALWRKAVSHAMDAGVLNEADPKITTRLLLGMAIWVSRWYRPTEKYTADDIADAAIQLITARRGRR
jgi:AcrR family transcriptional regulator